MAPPGQVYHAPGWNAGSGGLELELLSPWPIPGLGPGHSPADQDRRGRPDGKGDPQPLGWFGACPDLASP